MHKRFKGVDMLATVAKSAQKFCTVYVVSKGRLISILLASSTLSTNDNTEDANSLSDFFLDTSSNNSTKVADSTLEDSTSFSGISLPS